MKRSLSGGSYRKFYEWNFAGQTPLLIQWKCSTHDEGVPKKMLERNDAANPLDSGRLAEHFVEQGGQNAGSHIISLVALPP